MIEPGTYELRLRDLEADFEVTPEHLARLCDAVLTRRLSPPPALADIAFALLASDRFGWDGEGPSGTRAAETLHEWAALEVNMALNAVTVRKFRHRLVTGEDQFTAEDRCGRLQPRRLVYRPGAE